MNLIPLSALLLLLARAAELEVDAHGETTYSVTFGEDDTGNINEGDGGRSVGSNVKSATSPPVAEPVLPSWDEGALLAGLNESSGELAAVRGALRAIRAAAAAGAAGGAAARALPAADTDNSKGESGGTLPLSLDLRERGIGAAGAAALAVALPGSAVRALALGGNRLGDAGAAAVARAACDADSAVAELELDGNGVGDKGVAAIASALVGDRESTVQEEGAAEHMKEAAAMMGCPSITMLSLDRNAFSSAGAAALAAALARPSCCAALSDLALQGIVSSGGASGGEGGGGLSGSWGKGPRKAKANASGDKGTIADAWRDKHGDWAFVGKRGWLSTHRVLRRGF